MKKAAADGVRRHFFAPSGLFAGGEILLEFTARACYTTFI